MTWFGIEEDEEPTEFGHRGETIERSLELVCASTESGDEFSFRQEFNKYPKAEDPLGEGGMLSIRLLVEEWLAGGFNIASLSKDIDNSSSVKDDTNCFWLKQHEKNTLDLLTFTNISWKKFWLRCDQFPQGWIKLWQKLRRLTFLISMGYQEYVLEHFRSIFIDQRAQYNLICTLVAIFRIQKTSPPPNLRFSSITKFFQIVKLRPSRLFQFLWVLINNCLQCVKDYMGASHIFCASTLRNDILWQSSFIKTYKCFLRIKSNDYEIFMTFSFISWITKWVRLSFTVKKLSVIKRCESRTEKEQYLKI